jgi:hypothetical protein
MKLTECPMVLAAWVALVLYAEFSHERFKYDEYEHRRCYPRSVYVPHGAEDGVDATPRRVSRVYDVDGKFGVLCTSL